MPAGVTLSTGAPFTAKPSGPVKWCRSGCSHIDEAPFEAVGVNVLPTTSPNVDGGRRYGIVRGRAGRGASSVMSGPTPTTSIAPPFAPVAVEAGVPADVDVPLLVIVPPSICASANVIVPPVTCISR